MTLKEQIEQQQYEQEYFRNRQTEFVARRPNGCTCRLVMTNAGTSYMHIDEDRENCMIHGRWAHTAQR